MYQKLKTFSVTKYLYSGIIAGSVAAVLNNLYNSMYSSLTSFAIASVINPISISLGSVIPMIVAAVVYFGLVKITTKALLVFVIGTALFSLLSIAGPLASQLPDGSPTPHGFAALTIPMHIISGFCAIFIIPRVVAAEAK
ncbi:MAG: hypothetical protein WCI84_00685 [Bacteroidota bacterium]